MNTDKSARTLWDEKAKRRNPAPEVIEAFAKGRIDFIASHIPELANIKTLEVGSGDGYISRHLAPKTDLTALDLSLGMLRKNPSKRKIIASAYELPFANGSFDLVIESNMLHHLDRPVDALRELGRASTKWVFVSEPNTKSLPMYITHRLDPNERMSLHYNLAYLAYLCRQAGLHPVAKINFGWVTPNKTPAFMLPLLLWLEKVLPGGFFSMVLCSVGGL